MGELLRGFLREREPAFAPRRILDLGCGVGNSTLPWAEGFPGAEVHAVDVAAPLLCAGITTYSPLRRWGAGPGVKVAVVGVGGLGHMAVKIAAAMGAEVTTMSRSNAKADDALALGARAHLAASDEAAVRAARRSFDLIVNTVSAELPMDTYIGLLRPNGVMANVGLPMTPYSVFPFGLIGGNKVLTGSQIGGIAETQEMLDFCAEHGLGATIEMLDASDPAAVDAAWDRVVAGDVRYRVVIDTSTIGARVTQSRESPSDSAATGAHPALVP